MKHRNMTANKPCMQQQVKANHAWHEVRLGMPYLYTWIALHDLPVRLLQFVAIVMTLLKEGY